MQFETVHRAGNTRLPPGRLYGNNLRTRNIGCLTLTEISYPPRFRVGRHSHELSQLCFVRTGAFSEVFGGKSREVKPFTLIARPAGEVHAHSFHHGGTNCFVIEIGNESLRRVRETASLLEDSAEFQSGLLAWLGTKLYHEFRREDDASSLAIEGLILEMLSEVSRQGAVRVERKPPRWLERTREFLHEHYGDPITVTTLADMVGVHPTHLARVFRQFHRCTIGEYVRRLRIEFACRAVSLSNNSLTDIAAAAGFYDQSHFSRTFKQVTHLTPNQYRRTFRSR